jgi:hypothetical protein
MNGRRYRIRVNQSRSEELGIWECWQDARPARHKEALRLHPGMHSCTPLILLWLLQCCWVWGADSLSCLRWICLYTISCSRRGYLLSDQRSRGHRPKYPTKRFPAPHFARHSPWTHTAIVYISTTMQPHAALHLHTNHYHIRKCQDQHGHYERSRMHIPLSPA